MSFKRFTPAKRIDKTVNSTEFAQAIINNYPAQAELFVSQSPITGNNISLTIMGEPKAQKRHRSVNIKQMVSGKEITLTRQYDPSSSDKGDFLSIVQSNAPLYPFDCPIKLEINLYFTRPKSHFKSGRNSHILKDNAKTWHTSKPDSDNCIKFIMDALNKIFWRDDSLICNITIIKMYDLSPRTEINVTPLCC